MIKKASQHRKVMTQALPAFTIIELMVVMLLTSITVGLAYFSYNITIQQFLKYKTKEGSIAAQYTLHSCLSRDMRNAEDLIYSTEGFECRSAGMNVRYKLLPDRIVRQHVGVDTFITSNAELGLFYQKQKCVNPGELADELVLKYWFEDEEVVLDIHKEYLYKYQPIEIFHLASSICLTTRYLKCRISEAFY